MSVPGIGYSAHTGHWAEEKRPVTFCAYNYVSTGHRVARAVMRTTCPPPDPSGSPKSLIPPNHRPIAQSVLKMRRRIRGSGPRACCLEISTTPEASTTPETPVLAVSPSTSRQYQASA
eukprot:3513645-Rhodomonas_salina.1